MRNNKPGKKPEEVHGDSGGSNDGNQALGACNSWFVIESFPASTSNTVQGRGGLGYCGSSGTYEAQQEQELHFPRFSMQ